MSDHIRSFLNLKHHIVVTLYKTLGKLSDILHLNNRNNQLERRARPPQKLSSKRLVMDLSL